MWKMDQIGDYQIVNLTTGRLETLNEIFSNGACVIVFFRRWGCVFCRLWARELSEIAPILKEHNIRLIGVGIDESGKEEFISGKFFDGEIYQDYLKRTYSGMQFKRSNYLTLLIARFYSETRSARSKVHKMNLQGNLKGDKLQNGGLLIIDDQGEIIYEFRQERPCHFVSNNEILRVLNLGVFSKENITNLKEGELDIKEKDKNDLSVMTEESEESSNEIILNKEIEKNENLNKVNFQEDLDKIEKVELQDVTEPSNK